VFGRVLFYFPQIAQIYANQISYNQRYLRETLQQRLYTANAFSALSDTD
jgi:hypothetical protein